MESTDSYTDIKRNRLSTKEVRVSVDINVADIEAAKYIKNINRPKEKNRQQYV